MAGNFSCCLIRLPLNSLDVVAQIAAALIDQCENVFSANVIVGTKAVDADSPWFVVVNHRSRSLPKDIPEVRRALELFERYDLTEFAQDCTSDIHFMLAAQLSKRFGTALFVLESNATCSSTAIRFEAGELASVDSYGLGGTEQLVSGGPDLLRVEEVSVESINWQQFSAKAICEFLGVQIRPDVDDLLDDYWPEFAPNAYECKIVAGKVRTAEVKLVRRPASRRA